jgi:hypothetical protein
MPSSSNGGRGIDWNECDLLNNGLFSDAVPVGYGGSVEQHGFGGAIRSAILGCQRCGEYEDSTAVDFILPSHAKRDCATWREVIVGRRDRGCTTRCMR